MEKSPGKSFKAALAAERPLQIVGTVNAFCSILAEKAGHRAVYLSGAGVANASYGIPDLGLTTLENVLEDVRRITGASRLPLLVDVDTGWEDGPGIAVTIREMIAAGAACVHLEDQVSAKRCGHRPNKAVVSPAKMVDRVKAAVDARTCDDFMIMARTDAMEVEGLEAAVERASLYVEAGADAIFAEAVTDLKMYRTFSEAVKVPILANMTEFGKTPYYTRQEFAEYGVHMVLYPLSAFRAMGRAATSVYEAIAREGTQKSVLDAMQTRDELYGLLNYLEQEAHIDHLRTSDGNTGSEGGP